MAKLSDGRTRRLTPLLMAAAMVLAAPVAQAEDAPRADAAVDLIGTWHVLIHYTDDHSHDPTQMRWDDKIWVFEPSGSRLHWTEYPIVVFDDQTGRFEKLGGSHAARVVHGWEPNEAQRAQIMAGLEVNKRGSKTKTLRKQDDGSWASTARSTAASASIVTYIENWTVRGLADAPVFRREDTLGSGSTESYDGATEFATREILFDGNVLRGTFERDGTRHGTFQLTRAGTAEGVKGSGKSQSERVREAAAKNWFGTLAAVRRAEESESGRGTDDAEYMPSGFDPRPHLPEKGMTLAETIEYLHAAPKGYYRPMLRKLQVVHLQPDGLEVIPESDVESGAFEPVAGEAYGVLALVYCSAKHTYGENGSWYLVGDGTLMAWDHYQFGESCVFSSHFEPAEGELVAPEKRLAAHAREFFPRRAEVDAFLYTKGLALVGVGRIEDAEAMLARADENLDLEAGDFDSLHTSNRPNLISRTDRDFARTRLIEAIEAAKREAAGDSASADPD